MMVPNLHKALCSCVRGPTHGRHFVPSTNTTVMHVGAKQKLLLGRASLNSDYRNPWTCRALDVSFASPRGFLAYGSRPGTNALLDIVTLFTY
jgi:hypothetical protein